MLYIRIIRFEITIVNRNQILRPQLAESPILTVIGHNVYLSFSSKPWVLDNLKQTGFFCIAVDDNRKKETITAEMNTDRLSLYVKSDTFIENNPEEMLIWKR